MRQLLALSLLVFLISCSEPSQDEIVREKAETHLFLKLNDPDSYEFVSLELHDEILYSQNIEYRKNQFKDRLESTQRDIERTEESIGTSYEGPDTKERISKFQDELNQIQKFISGIDSLEILLGEDVNNVASYSYLYTFRANNAMGENVLNEYIVQVTADPEFTILKMTDDPDEIILNPNDFPGYRDMAMHFNNLSQMESQ